MANYSMWLLEYAHGKAQAWSWMVAGEHNKGEVHKVPFYYILIQGEGRTMMIDVGCDDNSRTHEMLEGFGVYDFQPPEVVLDRVGVHPKDVDTVFLTHAHFDHMGNLHSFPNATFYLQKRELIEWFAWLSLPERLQFFSFPIDRHDLVEASRLITEGRLILVEGEVEGLALGIRLLPAFDTHTFGMQYVVIEIGTGADTESWVCISDNAHEYENVEGIDGDGIIRPIGFMTGGVATTILSLENALQISGGVEKLIIGHSQDSFNRHPSRTYDDNLRMAELALASGEKSRLH